MEMILYAPMELIIRASKLRRNLVSLISAASALSFALAMIELLGRVRLGTAGRLFSVDAETSLPTWYATLSIASAAALLALIASVSRRRGERDSLSWAALSAIFVVISVDEITMVHEMVSQRLGELVPFTGWLRFAWVVPALLVLPAVGAAALPFLSRLPKRRRLQFVSAGAIYVCGALGMEMVGAKVSESMKSAALYSATGQMITPAYAACFHLEEFMEMLGIALFNCALVEHLAGLLGSDGLRLRFRDD